ncbi:MAG: SPFH/Band 7/PHB domain protein [Anaerotruncus sp.]|nr:SPFH/Band 7/PHB domain protein [Anaerotruncus sp.]
MSNLAFLGFLIPIILLCIIVVAIFVANFKVVPQSNVYIIERLGRYYTTWESGWHVKVPFLDRIEKRISLKEQVIDFAPQPVITKDNVTMQIDTVVFYQVTDAKLFAYGVDRPISAIENLTATTMRNIIGELELDSTLNSRDVINTKITATLDEETDRWGIKVIRVELKNILPPRETQEAMEKQMRAEREKREAIRRAEGEKESQILVAEGEKESAILRAEAERQSAILRAEAEKQSAILRAEGVREQKIREAQGEAEAIQLVQRAYADSLRMLSEADPSAKALQLKGLEAFQKAADGKATKIIIPSELQSLAGLLTAIKEIPSDR